MSTVEEPARVSLVPGATATTCELCTAETANTAVPAMTVVVQHPRGGAVDLAACEWCVQAIRRLSAATGGQAVFTMSHAAAPPPSTLAGAPRGSRPASLPVLIATLTQEINDTAGLTYVVRVYGRERTDGNWEAWLEFVAVGAALARRTDLETTQSTKQDVAYWASGLGPAFLEGAFARSQPTIPPSAST
jgi:hypothetical protein